MILGYARQGVVLGSLCTVTTNRVYLMKSHGSFRDNYHSLFMRLLIKLLYQVIYERRGMLESAVAQEAAGKLDVKAVEMFERVVDIDTPSWKRGWTLYLSTSWSSQIQQTCAGYPCSLNLSHYTIVG